MANPPPIPTPAEPEYFDYRGPARDARISLGDLAALIRIFEADYPSDLMLRELHVLRVCHAVARGSISIRRVLDVPDSRAA